VIENPNGFCPMRYYRHIN